MKAFTYKEPFSEFTKSKLPENLVIHGNRDSGLLLLLRALSGSIDIFQVLYGKKIKPRKNYFAQDLKGYGAQWRVKFPELLGESVSAEDLSEFIKFERANNGFYQEILSEVSNFILYDAKGSHTTAFVYLYRILEKISYAFPAIYFSSTDDFLNSFQSLKSLMNETGNKGELSFFKKFVKHITNENGLAEYTIDISIAPQVDAPDIDIEEVRESIYKEIRRILLNANIELAEPTIEPRIISVSVYNVGSVIVTVRNRFFHNQNDEHDNIKSEHLLDSDIFFAQLNKSSMHWIALIFLQILTTNLSNFLRVKQYVNNNNER